jgi:hypothetical protein
VVADPRDVALAADAEHGGDGGAVDEHEREYRQYVQQNQGSVNHFEAEFATRLLGKVAIECSRKPIHRTLEDP